MRTFVRASAAAVLIVCLTPLTSIASDVSSNWNEGAVKIHLPGPTSHPVVNPGHQMTQEEYFAWFRAKYPGIHYQALCHGVPSIPGDPCPAAPPPVLGQNPIQIPGDNLLLEGDLPLAQPNIAPGRAITGLRSYLVISGDTQFGASRSDGIGYVYYDCNRQNTVHVDWGDHTDEHFDNPGAPYPNGTVTHVYQTIGDYDVTVTTNWNCDYTQNGVPFQKQLNKTAVLPKFPVLQVQAIVDG